MNIFVPHQPTSGEEGSYNRRASFFKFARTFSWVWKFADGMTITPWPVLQARINGAPNGEPVASADGKYKFTCTVEDGHHLFDVIGLPLSVECMTKPFLVNDSGSPLPVQNPWTSTMRFERRFGDRPLSKGAVRVPYPGVPVVPKGIKFKPRDIQPFAERLPGSKLWTRRIQKHTRGGMLRQFVRVPTGDVVIEPNQKYFYADAITASREHPPVSLFDGPRDLGSLGFLYTCIISPQATGFYFSDVFGRIGFVRTSDGNVITIAGFRHKPGQLKPHGALREISPGKESQFYIDGLENVGDWSKVPEPKRFRESWGMAALPDPRMPGLHEFWVADTMNHRILYINHWTAHSADHYMKPLYAPSGYAAPDAPTGQSDIVVFLDAVKLGMTGPCPRMNEPWDIAIHPETKRVYWTNYGNGNISSAAIDSTDAKVEFLSAGYPSDSQLGLPFRLNPTRLTATECRTKFSRDGVEGVGTFVRPQALAFNSKNVLHVVDRYSFNLRVLDLETKTVTTLAEIPTAGGTSFGQYDYRMAIDIDGSFGPQDDIFLLGWHIADYRYGADGTYYGHPFTATGDANFRTTTGVLSKSAEPGYAWGLGIGKGIAIVQGNAGGWQFWEVTKRLPTDPEPDLKKYMRGRDAYYKGASPPMVLTHGPEGQGELGYPTVDEMGGWSDDVLRNYGIANGIPVASIEDWIYWVRYMTVDMDYTTVPVDTMPPSQPQFDLTVTIGV